MRVGIVACDFPHQIEHAYAFSEGLVRHGISSTIYPDHKVPDEDIVACWGWRLGEPLFRSGKRVLVIERGFIDRMNWTSFGWDGLNGRARRDWQTEGHIRLHTVLPHGLKMWNPNGKYSLIVGQVSGDMSVQMTSLPDWYQKSVSNAKGFGYPIKFRPHPVALEYGESKSIPGAETLHGSLSDALHDAAVVITYNSNTGVDALLSGKPTIVCDEGSMAWPIADHSWRIQEEPYRTDWASRLAWSQFSLDEIRSGYVWDIVKDS